VKAIKCILRETRFCDDYSTYLELHLSLRGNPGGIGAFWGIRGEKGTKFRERVGWVKKARWIFFCSASWSCRGGQRTVVSDKDARSTSRLGPPPLPKKGSLQNTGAGQQNDLKQSAEVHSVDPCPLEHVANKGNVCDVAKYSKFCEDDETDRERELFKNKLPVHKVRWVRD